MKSKIQTPLEEVVLLKFAIIESKNQRDKKYNSGNYIRDKVKHYYYLQLKKTLLIMKTR